MKGVFKIFGRSEPNKKGVAILLYQTMELGLDSTLGGEY